MWQRVQTLYFALATGLLASLFFCDACTVAGPDGLEGIRYTALQKPYFLILMVIWGLGTFLALVTFKSRILQMRLAVLSAIIALGMQVWLLNTTRARTIRTATRTADIIRYKV